jgi:hypothetical protein
MCAAVETRVLASVALMLLLVSANASATPVISGPPAPQSDAANIAGLTNQYLQQSIGASTQGGWLDASAAGSASDRGQSLLIPGTILLPPGSGTTVTIDGFNNATQATVHFNDGAGGMGTEGVFLSQFSVTYNSTSTGFDTFCIDLLHTVAAAQTYAVNSRDDVASAFTNGARMAYIFDNFGEGDLTNDPDQAAAVQLALWDLSLSNHDPMFFAQDPGGSYSSGDPNVFSVTFASSVPEPASAALLFPSLAVICRRCLPRKAIRA